MFASSTIHAQTVPPRISLTQNWRLQDAAKALSSGAALSSVAYKPSAWYAATVPGTVLTTLVNNGVYPEPLYGENNQRIPDSLSTASYWYRTTFTAPASYAGRRVWLSFEGINHKAEVWVNGQNVGRIEGAFTRGVFDVTPFVTIGKRSAVAVKIAPPPHASGGISHPSNPVPQTLANGYGPNGGNMEGDSPTFFCAEGWDWIPTIHDRDIGLWRNVSLSATGPVVVKDPYVTNSRVTAGGASADLTLRVDLQNVTDRAQTGVLKGNVAGRAFSQNVTIAANSSRTVTLAAATTPALHLAHPKLWWPNGYGSQNLYTIPLTFTIGKTESDARPVTFGVRTIDYGGVGDGKGTLKLSVNGVPIMMRGGDWGMDEALKRSPAARLEAQIRLNKEAGFTMIRNWCGQTTQEDFYALCDKYGILVWNDFWLDDTVNYPIDAAMFLANERDTLLRFRNHPSIALWCQRNEFPVGTPFEKQMIELAAELDPGRWFQPCSSSQYGVGDGDYGIETVAHYFGPFKDSFHTEIGAPSIPTLEALHAMMPRQDWATFNDDWTQHDLCQYNYAPALTARYGPIADTADFVRKAHLADYETYRAMIEGRNSRMFDPCTGVMLWMSNPAQPSLVWQIYGYDLEPTAAYFGVRRACEMTHVQMTPDGALQVINNRPESLAGLKVQADVYAMDGARIFERSTSASVPGASVASVFPIVWLASSGAVSFVKLTLKDARGKLMSSSFYWRANRDDGDCSALQSLPSASLATHAVRTDRAGMTTLAVTLTNRAKSVALMAHLQLRRRTTGARVLPAYYSDNYVSLLPGESQALTVQTATADLAGDTPLVTVDGWNVTAAPWSGAGVSVGPNPDAGLARPAEVRNIDCGVGWLPGYASDCCVAGGAYACTDDAIDVAGVPGAAPAILYRTERNGECIYTVPAKMGETYDLALHFAETYFQAKGQRVFHVDVNGERKLKDFDIFAAAGGRNRANVQRIADVHPDANGNIVIRFVKGDADQPKICGIQIIPKTERR
ncbi:hypothetical protein CCAX7_41080 [Capsulimonas corticalis]|uniref:Uncharacterized protein n=1 Tax=Capsulimonas corticalis TaxID=2219043 RepID=A0A402D675_9BACT|nr:malectin domain-containing carbohydrate-binding protein [Capsulimonas corticalis]BDI32057.1 hypothetical protein CCAX7_41080 [Capsulimonas corticalis]